MPNHHTQTKQVLNRMSRIVGHTEAIKRMCEEGKSCSDILIQIAAVRSALNNVGKVILKDHIDHCIVDTVEKGNEEALGDLHDAINKFIK